MVPMRGGITFARPHDLVVATAKAMTLDRRTLVASCLFFFVALVNPRDFPIENLPLIYPAFVVFAMQMGFRKTLQGFQRTKYLCLLLVGYQCYYFALRTMLGLPNGVGDLAYLIDPVMIMTAAGAATVRVGGTRAAIWAFLAVITLSTACGDWIYFIGEPITSLRSTLQSSIGGSLASGTMTRDIDLLLEEDLTAVLSLNAGLSKDVFTFSYQLAAGIIITILAALSEGTILSMRSQGLIAAFIVLTVGALTNTERATVFSVAIGLAAGFHMMKGGKAFNIRAAAVLSIGILTVAGIVMLPSVWSDKEALHKRAVFEDTTYTRLSMAIPAIASTLYQPLGAGGASEHYNEAALQRGWVRIDQSGNLEAHSPHNHFANVIMYGGVVGVAATILLFEGLRRKIRHVRHVRLRTPNREALILAAACITSLVHSFTHNAGFFGLVPPTLIVFALLWGEAENMAGEPVQAGVRVGTRRFA